jgi:RHS repeat-associated protein
MGNHNLFNGNISYMVTDFLEAGDKLPESDPTYSARLYNYDQLNRIVQNTNFGVYTYNPPADLESSASYPWAMPDGLSMYFSSEQPTSNKAYNTTYSYDGKGNLTSLNRYSFPTKPVVDGQIVEPDGQSGDQAIQIDEISYAYNGVNNQLTSVSNNAGYERVLPPARGAIYINEGEQTGRLSNYTKIVLQEEANVPESGTFIARARQIIDLKPGFETKAEANAEFLIGEPEAEDAIMPGVPTQGTNNYSYNERGQLISDVQGDAKIAWTSDDKVDQVTDANNVNKLAFIYDEQGNRITKTNYTGGSAISTFYLRDASGNVMATYDHTGSVKERFIYGSSRLGGLSGEVTEGRIGYGQRKYELTNHLGNVLAIITDKKIFDESTGENTSNYKPDIVSLNDYYPFGAPMEGRNYSGYDYRFGFNGKELDKADEGWGSAIYDYGFRVYNPGIAKFLSVDPLAPEYPWYTPYQFAGNRPIKFIDLDGLEEYEMISHWFTKPKLQKENVNKEESQVSQQVISNYNRDKDNGNNVTGKVLACYPTVWKRVQGAYKDSKIQGPKELNKPFTKTNKNSNRIWPKGYDDFTKLFSTSGGRSWSKIDEVYRAKGAPGALASVGFADIIDDVWSGDLQPGAVLQMWNTESDFKSLRDDGKFDNWDYASNFVKLRNIWNGARTEKEINNGTNAGHSAIFIGYTRSHGIITGLRYADQWGEKEVSRFSFLQPYNFVVGGNISDNKEQSNNDQ